MLPYNQLASNDFDKFALVTAQVEKIANQSRLSTSSILKKFLRFVVAETLKGHAHSLKEFTIAVEVLKKPITFDPQRDCVVRVHAARLRRILNEYYSGPGANDDLIIMLPKGHYVPVFEENPKKGDHFGQPVSDDLDLFRKEESANVKMAVIPFHYAGTDATMVSLADGLGLSLSAELMKLNPRIKVISYNLVRLRGSTDLDFGSLGAASEPQYIFAGNVQGQKNKVRVTIQLVRAVTHEQVWCRVYEYEINPEQVFKLQDDFAVQVVEFVRNMKFLSEIRAKPSLVVAIA